MRAPHLQLVQTAEVCARLSRICPAALIVHCQILVRASTRVTEYTICCRNLAGLLALTHGTHNIHRLSRMAVLIRRCRVWAHGLVVMTTVCRVKHFNRLWTAVDRQRLSLARTHHLQSCANIVVTPFIGWPVVASSLAEQQRPASRWLVAIAKETQDRRWAHGPELHLRLGVVRWPRNSTIPLLRGSDSIEPVLVVDLAVHQSLVAVVLQASPRMSNRTDIDRDVSVDACVRNSRTCGIARLLPLLRHPIGALWPGKAHVEVSISLAAALQLIQDRKIARLVAAVVPNPVVGGTIVACALA